MDAHVFWSWAPMTRPVPEATVATGEEEAALWHQRRPLLVRKCRRSGRFVLVSEVKTLYRSWKYALHLFYSLMWHISFNQWCKTAKCRHRLCCWHHCLVENRCLAQTLYRDTAPYRRLLVQQHNACKRGSAGSRTRWCAYVYARHSKREQLNRHLWMA